MAQTTPAPAVPDATSAASAHSRSKNEDQALKWFRLLDANGDGRISRQEAEVGIRLRPSLADEFKAADLNGDGYVTEDEIRTVAERRRAEREARRERERTAALRQGNAGGTGR